jgi:hypothetical protein
VAGLEADFATYVDCAQTTRWVTQELSQTQGSSISRARNATGANRDEPQPFESARQVSAANQPASVAAAAA